MALTLPGTDDDVTVVPGKIGIMNAVETALDVRVRHFNR